KNAIESTLAQALQAASVVRAGSRLLDSSVMEGLKSGIVAAATNFHKKNPLVGGISKEELRAQVDASPEVFEAVAAMLLREKKIEIAGELVRLPGLGVVMKDEEA